MVTRPVFETAVFLRRKISSCIHGLLSFIDCQLRQTATCCKILFYGISTYYLRYFDITIQIYSSATVVLQLLFTLKERVCMLRCRLEQLSQESAKTVENSMACFVSSFQDSGLRMLVKEYYEWLNQGNRLLIWM